MHNNPGGIFLREIVKWQIRPVFNELTLIVLIYCCQLDQQQKNLTYLCQSIKNKNVTSRKITQEKTSVKLHECTIFTIINPDFRIQSHCTDLSFLGSILNNNSQLQILDNTVFDNEIYKQPIRKMNIVHQAAFSIRASLWNFLLIIF